MIGAPLPEYEDTIALHRRRDFVHFHQLAQARLDFRAARHGIEHRRGAGIFGFNPGAGTGAVNEFTIRTPRDAKGLIDDLARRGVIGGLPVSRLAPNAGLDDLVLVAATELDSAADRAAYAAALAQCL